MNRCYGPHQLFLVLHSLDLGFLMVAVKPIVVSAEGAEATVKLGAGC